MQVRLRPVIKWKVVYGDNGKLYSSIAGPCLRVSYQEGKWTTATIGGLLVFNTRREARDYSRGLDIIYKCECRKPVQLPTWGLDLRYLTKRRAKTLWNPNTVLSILEWNPNRVARWPPGTLAFKRIKLIKEVRHK